MTRCIAVLATSLFATACVVDETDDSSYWESQGGNAIPPEIMDAPIDPGAQIDVTPGTGTGLFIEYRADGTWHLFTSCDTELSNVGCAWDVLAMIPRSQQLAIISSEDVEPDDYSVRIDDGAINWILTTDVDFDGIVLQAPPGQSLRVDAFLDGNPALRFVNWISDGAVNVGVPTNPIDFAPNAP